MSSIEISGKNFLFDAAATVPFFRAGNIPDAEILGQLSRIRSAYVSRGAEVKDAEWQAVLNFYHLPGETPKVSPQG